MTAASTKTAAETAEKPRFLVIEDTLKVQTEQGEISLPLRFKTKLLREFGKLEQMDAFFIIVDSVAGPETAAVIDELDILETTEIMVQFFKHFEEKVQATMGESLRSSN